MGRPYPGHRVAVIDDDGSEVPRGEPGDVAVHRIAPDGTPDPVFFLEYLEQSRRHAQEVHRRLVPHRRRRDAWTPTATSGTRAAPTTCSRSRATAIGPSEIENCLVKHPAVANAAVVPSPDETRGNVVKAFVVLAAGHAPSTALEDDIQQHVRKFLAPYEYPKEIEFIDALPMTTTGKVQRKVLREREAARKTRERSRLVQPIGGARCLALRVHGEAQARAPAARSDRYVGRRIQTTVTPCIIPMSSCTSMWQCIT